MLLLFKTLYSLRMQGMGTSLESRIPVALGADQGYYPGLVATVFTTLTSCSCPERLAFLIFDGGIDNCYRQELEELVLRFGNTHPINWIHCDQIPFDGLVSMEGSKLAYCRLLLPRETQYSRVIWLDSDLLVFTDILELWETDLGNALAAAALDDGELGRDITNCRALGLNPTASYFNSGVLLLDLARLRSYDFTEKAIRYLQENHGYYSWHDQSAVNVVLSSQIKELPQRFNYQNRLFIASPCKKMLDGKGYIYHFLERPKPWQRYSGEPHCQIFYKVMRLIGIELAMLKTMRNRAERIKWLMPRFTSYLYYVRAVCLPKERAKVAYGDRWMSNHQMLKLGFKKYVRDQVSKQRDAYASISRL